MFGDFFIWFCTSCVVCAFFYVVFGEFDRIIERAVLDLRGRGSMGAMVEILKGKFVAPSCNGSGNSNSVQKVEIETEPSHDIKITLKDGAYLWLLGSDISNLYRERRAMRRRMRIRALFEWFLRL